MEIVIKGEPREIAALVLAVQERREKEVLDCSAAGATEEERSQLANSIRTALLSQLPKEIQSQQLDSTECKQNQGEELHPQESDL